MDPAGRSTRSRYPNFAALAARRPGIATQRRSPTTPPTPCRRADRRATRARTRCRPRPTPPQPVHVARRGLRVANVTEPATDLCPSRLCADAARPPTDERLKSLGKDLDRRAPPGPARAARRRAAGRQPGVRQLRRPGAGRPGDRRRVAIPGLAFEDRVRPVPPLRSTASMTPRTASTSSTCCSRTLRGSTCRAARATAPSRGGVPGLGRRVSGRRTPPAAAGVPARPAPIGYADRLSAADAPAARQGLYDARCSSLTADHGSASGPGPPPAARGAAAADVLGVPLFVKRPGQRRGPSTTATLRRPTCCQPSPMRSARPALADRRQVAARRRRGRCPSP